MSSKQQRKKKSSGSNGDGSAQQQQPQSNQFHYPTQPNPHQYHPQYAQPYGAPPLGGYATPQPYGYQPQMYSPYPQPHMPPPGPGYQGYYPPAGPYPYQHPPHQPPVHRPPVHQPPVHQPPVNQPPIHQPPIHQPPIHQPANDRQLASPSPRVKAKRGAAPPGSPKVEPNVEPPPPSYEEVVGNTKHNKIITSKDVDKDLGEKVKGKEKVMSGDSERTNSPRVHLGDSGSRRRPSKDQQKSSRNYNTEGSGRGIGGRGRDIFRGRPGYRGRGFLPRRGGFSQFRARRADVDRRSEVTSSSIGQEQDELSIELQRQFIKEIDIASVSTDTKGILIEVKNGFSDYHPLALKNFLEHCTGNECRVTRMVISTDKQSAVAVFDRDIDHDELGHFITEPQNQFLDLELDFDEIDEFSALIAFTEDEYEELMRKLEEVWPDTSGRVRDWKQSDDFTIISFNDASQSELDTFMKKAKDEESIDIYPLYAYPAPDYMHVVKQSYFSFDAPALITGSAAGFQLLLSQLGEAQSDRELRKVMTISNFSGGDSTAQVRDADSAHERIVTYATAEVCVNVASRSPIKYKVKETEKFVGYASLSAGVPVDESVGFLSRSFLMLTGVDGAELTKDVIKYYCANYGKRNVAQVYFTGDEKTAVVMFSSAAVTTDSKPADFVNLSRALESDPDLVGVRAWRLLSVTTVRLSGFGSSDKTVGDKVAKWSGGEGINVRCQSVDKSNVNLEFRNEQDVVKFLERSNDDTKLAFGEYCLEMPVIDSLPENKLLTERLRSLLPRPVPISTVIEDLGLHDDYTKYIRIGAGGKELRKVMLSCQARHYPEEFRPDTQNLNKNEKDLVKLFSSWRKVLNNGIEEMLNALSVMDECTVSLAQWNELKKNIPNTLCVVDEMDGNRSVTLRALGSASDVSRFESLISSSDQSATTSTRQITMTLSDANFIKNKSLAVLKVDFPRGSSVDINFGSEMATAMLKAKSDEDLDEVERRLTECRESLLNRQFTIGSAHWEFLNSRKSHAFVYLNRMLDVDNTQYTCSGKPAGPKLVKLTTDSKSKENLTQAEQRLRDSIIIKEYMIVGKSKNHAGTVEIWNLIKQFIEKILRKQMLPFLMVEPKDTTGKVQIVSVVDAREILDQILLEASNFGRSENSENTGAKPKTFSPNTADQKKEAKKKKEIPALMAVPAFPKLASEFSGIRLDSGSSEEEVHTEEIKLSQSQQYIEYLFCTKNLRDLLKETDLPPWKLNFEKKTIKIQSSTSKDVKKVKSGILDLIKKLHKDTREISEGADLAEIEAAARGMQVQYLIHESQQLMDFSVGHVSVVVCRRAIQCIRADAVIIAVEPELYMNQSGVGGLLAAADPIASKELRRRFSKDISPGSCIEIPSSTKSTLFSRYIVIVVDTKDKSSLERGLAGALEVSDRMRLSSLVTNLLGRDMRAFLSSEKESAVMMMNCLSRHVTSREKTRLQKLFICETNDFKINCIKEEVKKHGQGTEFNDTALPDIGAKMLSVCCSTKHTGDTFLVKCASELE